MVGIDAGGSKTLGLLADETGEIRAEARAGGANPRVDGADSVVRALRSVLEPLRRRGEIGALCIGMAGAGREPDRHVIREVAEGIAPGARLRIEHDAAVALAAGVEDGVGIALVAGTGAMAYGVDGTGTAARAGGWGHRLADQGSAYWLGRETLMAAAAALDGRRPDTVLGRLVSEELEIDGSQQLVAWAYGPAYSRQRVASLCPLVQRAADTADRTADELLTQAAEHLAVAVRAVESSLSFPEGCRLLLAGGVFRACPSLPQRLSRALSTSAARPESLGVEPAVGAVRLARELLASEG